MKDCDVIVIGSGIGGLSCAGILAGRGLSVLVLEKNINPGGYLTSFKRKGFIFDSTVDCFSGMDECGAIRHLLKELDVENKIEFIRVDPIRESIFPGIKIKTWSNVNVYIESLKELFPAEKNIEGFFKKMEEIYNDINTWAGGILHNVDNKSTFPTVLLKYGGITYRSLLNSYLYDERLKSILSDRCSFLGLPPSKISAVSMALLLMSYFISGAYRPIGGCQKLSDVLVEGIKKKGGNIFFEKEVSKIIMEGSRAVGVTTGDGASYTAHYVVSNIDYAKTFFMLGGNYIFEAQNTLQEFGVSPSFFILYIGAKTDLSFLGASSSIGYFPSYDMEKAFDFKNSFSENTPIGLTIPTVMDSSMSPYNSHSIAVHELTDYAYSKSWKEEKEKVSELILNKAEKIIPNLKKQAVHIEAATPATLERYTANFRGAAYGWQQLPWLRPVKTMVANLYLAGHWGGLGGGVIAATYSGLKTAKEILKQSMYKI